MPDEQLDASGLRKRERGPLDQRPVSVVVISKDQLPAVQRMLAGLREQIPGFSRVFVLDRTSDGSAEYLDSEGETFVEKPGGLGFEAGAVRELGLSLVPGTDDILFLDVDRVPRGLTEWLVLEALRLYDFCLLRAETDGARKWFTPEFSDNPHYGLWNNSVFTCGLTVRRDAVSPVRRLCRGFFFDPLFDGAYGSEDMYLGDVGYHIGLTCGGFPDYVALDGAVGVMDEGYKGYRMAEQIHLRSKLRDSLRQREVLPQAGLEFSKDPPGLRRNTMRDKILGRK